MNKECQWIKQIVCFSCSLLIILICSSTVHSKGDFSTLENEQGSLEQKRQRLLAYLASVEQFQQSTTKEGKEGIRLIHAFLAGKQTELESTKQLLTTAVQAKDTEAMVWLSQLYAQGLGGVEQDVSKAQHLLEQATEMGNAAAAYHLGVFLYEQQTGIGDSSKAISLIKQAKSKNYPLANSALGKIALFSGQDQQAKRYFEEGVREGDLSAMVSLSGMYQSGNYFPDPNNRGLSLLETAWEQGWHDAGLNLYTTYLNGKGVKKDVNKALGYLRQTAAMGSGDAYAFLCSITANGDHGIKKDIDIAIQLCEQGITFNSIIAPHNLANLISKNFSDSESLIRVSNLQKLAAEKGNPAAMNNYGSRILSDKDQFFGSINNNIGYSFIRKSAELGWPRGMLFYVILSNDYPEKDIPKLNGPDYQTCWYWASILQGISPGKVSSGFIVECGAQLTEEYKQSKQQEISHRIQFYQRNRWTNDYLRLIRSGMKDLNQG